jgi:hypothetical protein
MFDCSSESFLAVVMPIPRLMKVSRRRSMLNRARRALSERHTGHNSLRLRAVVVPAGPADYSRPTGVLPLSAEPPLAGGQGRKNGPAGQQSGRYRASYAFIATDTAKNPLSKAVGAFFGTEK